MIDIIKYRYHCSAWKCTDLKVTNFLLFLFFTLFMMLLFSWRVLVRDGRTERFISWELSLVSSLVNWKLFVFFKCSWLD